jgi:hypothetical protein
LSILAQKLEDEGSPDKAAEALFKMAKLAGWLEAEATVSVIAGLTSKELEEAKRKIQTRMASEGDQPVVIN